MMHNASSVFTFFMFVRNIGPSSVEVDFMKLRTFRHNFSRTPAATSKVAGILFTALLSATPHAAVAQGQGQAQGQAPAPMPASVDKRADLVVNFDQSTLLQLSRPADLVIVGNPSIADVAIQSGTLLVITGKSFGITNIIVLDAERKVIQDQRLMVRRDEEKVVNLIRGKDRQTWNCTGGQCNPSMTVGDDPLYFSQVKELTTSKSSTSEKADSGGGNN
jgi:hypothetical protein